MPGNEFNEQLDAFLEYLQNNRATSENTVTNYAVDLAQYADFIENQQMALKDVTSQTVRAFLRSLSGFGYASSSIARKLSAVKTFEHYLLEKNFIHSDPAAPVRSPRIPERLPRALSREAMNSLLAEAWKIEPCLRNGTLMEVLYACGLRVSELVSVLWKDVDLEGRTIRVLGKGDKERYVLFGKYAFEALSQWKDACSADEVYLFPGKRGGHITVRTVHRVVVQAALQAGLVGVTPHSVRHSFATHMLEGGAPLNVLQELLGHESLLTTQRYLKITPGHLRDSYMAAHPRAGEEEHH
ncbi:MAG: tyrosine recombinase XerC [Pyramidobacter sp.]